MPRNRLFAEDGADIGEIRLAVCVGPGDFIHVGAGERLRVTALVPVDEPDSPDIGSSASSRMYRRTAEGTAPT